MTPEERARNLRRSWRGCPDPCEGCPFREFADCDSKAATLGAAIVDAVNEKLEEAKQPYVGKPSLSSFTAHITICKRLDALKLPVPPDSPEKEGT